MNTFPKLFFITFISFALSTGVNTAGANTCEHKAAGFASQFAQLIREQKYDAMPALLFQWEQECGNSEPVFRARGLQLIAGGMFPGMLPEDQFLDQAIAFEIRGQLISQQLQDDYFLHHQEYFGYVPLNTEFDRQTRRWAGTLLQSGNFYGPALLFLQLWSGDHQAFFLALKQGDYDNTPLGEQYKERVTYFLRKPEINLGIQTGIWMPFESLAALGNHPLLGLNLGMKKGRNYLDLGFYFRFGKTPSPVSLIVKDTLAFTRNHQGAWLGLEYSRVLLSFSTAQLEWHGGVGYDLVELVEQGQDPERFSYGSVSLNTGFTYRYIFPNRTWLSLKPSFVLLNHKGNAALSLQGHAILFSVAYGFTENPRKSQNLRRLGHHKW